VQTFGDFPERFYPHCHVLCSNGCFYGRGAFRLAPKFHLRDLESLCRHKVLRMLLRKKKISPELIRMLDGWRHSGFNVFAGERIQPREKKSLEWLAAMACHVQERGKQTIRYHGAYANSVRGKLRRRQEEGPIPTVLEPVISSEAFRHNWARLIQKMYEVSPLACACYPRIPTHRFRPLRKKTTPGSRQPTGTVEPPRQAYGLPLVAPVYSVSGRPAWFSCLFDLTLSPAPTRAQFSPPAPQDHTTSCILFS
jgi:hypothetical protein